MESSLAIYATLGAVVGALITGGFVILNAYFQRRSDMHARVIAAAFNIAAVEWRAHIDLQISGTNRSPNGVLPLDIYMFTPLEIARLAPRRQPITILDILRTKKSSKELVRKFREDITI